MHERWRISLIKGSGQNEDANKRKFQSPFAQAFIPGWIVHHRSILSAQKKKNWRVGRRGWGGGGLWQSLNSFCLMCYDLFFRVQLSKKN